jgi:hypothetical protein
MEGGFAGDGAVCVWQSKDGAVRLTTRHPQVDTEETPVHVTLTGGVECPVELLDLLMLAAHQVIPLDTGGKRAVGGFDQNRVYSVAIKEGDAVSTCEVNSYFVPLDSYPFYQALLDAEAYPQSTRALMEAFGPGIPKAVVVLREVGYTGMGGVCVWQNSRGEVKLVTGFRRIDLENTPAGDVLASGVECPPELLNQLMLEAKRLMPFDTRGKRTPLGGTDTDRVYSVAIKEDHAISTFEINTDVMDPSLVSHPFFDALKEAEGHRSASKEAGRN